MVLKYGLLFLNPVGWSQRYMITMNGGMVSVTFLHTCSFIFAPSKNKKIVNTNYQSYIEKSQKIADIHYASAVLNWDMSTYMPEKGNHHRAQQLSTLTGIAHDLSTDNELGNLLEVLCKDSTLSDGEKRNVQLSQKSYLREKKFTTEFVIEKSKAISEAYHAWVAAREANDFKIYEPSLKKLVDIVRKEAEILDYEDHPYDALLDLYEPDAKTNEIDAVFADVKTYLVPFVKQILAKETPQNNFLQKHYEKDKQWNFGMMLLEKMGYDFKAGRQDISVHPFTTSFSPLDVRVTTRINEHDFTSMTWSCIHEGGHALYEQGLPVDQYGLPLGEAVSLGIHESQSRLWENCVGRSLSYWKANYSELQKSFPENLSTVLLTDFYKAINLVKQSFIRTESDELTYHLHVFIRFEIEKGLIEGSLHVHDLPEIWNAKYKEYLGVDVPDDKTGVLQDIHWSHGSFGYFPTYSLGSFYAVQFFNQAKKDMPNLVAEIESGNTSLLLKWLREKIHSHGKMFSAQALCERVTGEKLNFSHFMNYAKEKYGAIYSV